jgi:hypothetical protein
MTPSFISHPTGKATALDHFFPLRTDIVMNALRSITAITATVLLSSLAAPSAARATTITYTTVGSFSGTTFTTSGLTATAENGGTLAIVAGTGLGVLGGLGGSGGSFDAIDGDESVRFSFDSGGATDVAFGSIAAFSNGSQLMNLEAFDVHGVSLGVQTFNIFDSVSLDTPLDVSALFGDVVLSAFRIDGNGQTLGIELHRVAFTDAPPAAVPEPTTLLLCTTGLALAGVRKIRSRRLQV